MREVNVDKVTENIKEMCIEANHFLTDDMKTVSYTHLTLPTTERV